MIYDSFIEVGGDIISSPEFKKDKNGRAYVTFWVQTSNSSANDRKVLRYRCFAWDGEVFRVLENAKLSAGDNLMVKGIFSIYESVKIINKKNGDTVQKPFFELRIYVKYVKVVDTRKYVDMLLKKGLSTTGEINLEEKEITENKNQQFILTDEDDTF